MLSILATGQARYNTGSITNNINFDNQSTIIGENSGKDLKIGEGVNIIQKNFNNTFVGYKAGQYSIASIENIFIGYQSGSLLNGSNNIMIGKNSDNGILETSYDAISIGRLNKSDNNSVSIGSYNNNLGYFNYVGGNENYLNGNFNLLEGNTNILYNSFQTINLGYNNNSSNIYNSIIYGNENISSNLYKTILLGNNNIFESSNSILLGNNNNLNLTSNSIYIGNNLSNSNYNINIGNTFIKYDNTSNNEILFLGINNKYSSNYLYNNSNLYGLHVAVGFLENDIQNLDNNMTSNSWSSLYIKNGINTDSITFQNYNISNIPNITFSIPNTINDIYISSNINYKLPYLPIDASNLVLSTNNLGELFWKEANILFETDSISKYTTNDLREGNNNLYYTNSRVDSRVYVYFHDNFNNKFNELFYPKINQITADQIDAGTSNKYITNGIINQDIMIFGTLTVNKIQVLGTDIKNETGFNSYIANIINNTSNELMNTIQILMNRIEYLENKLNI